MKPGGIGREECVAGGDQPRRRALVVAQRVRCAGLPAGGQVGVQVSIAKAVDRLLGITDEEQWARCLRIAGGVDTAEDRVLQGIRVLELVDQCHRIAAAQGFGEPREIAGSERCIDVQEHVVEGLHAQPALLLAQRGGGLVEHPAQQVQAGEVQCLRHRRVPRQQIVGGGEEGMRGRRLVLLRPGGDHVRREETRLAGFRNGSAAQVAAGEPHGPGAGPGADAVLPVRTGVERGEPGEQYVGRSGAIAPP
jgi:hypothetical protein